MYAYMHVCVYVFMYVCVCVYIHTYISIYIRVYDAYWKYFGRLRPAHTDSGATIAADLGRGGKKGPNSRLGCSFPRR